METKIYIDAEKILDKYPPIIEIAMIHIPTNEHAKKITEKVKRLYNNKYGIFIINSNKGYVKIHSIFKSEQKYIKAEKLLEAFLKKLKLNQ